MLESQQAVQSNVSSSGSPFHNNLSNGNSSNLGNPLAMEAKHASPVQNDSAPVDVKPKIPVLTVEGNLPPLTDRGQKADAKLQENPYDIEAWNILIKEHQLRRIE